MPVDFGTVLPQDGNLLLNPVPMVSTPKKLYELLQAKRLWYEDDKITLLQSTDIAVALYQGLLPFKIVIVSARSPDAPPGMGSILMRCIFGSQVLRAIEKFYRPGAYNVTPTQADRFDNLEIDVVNYRNIHTEIAHQVCEAYKTFGLDEMFITMKKREDAVARWLGGKNTSST